MNIAAIKKTSTRTSDEQDKKKSPPLKASSLLPDLPPKALLKETKPLLLPETKKAPSREMFRAISEDFWLQLFIIPPHLLHEILTNEPLDDISLIQKKLSTHEEILQKAFKVKKDNPKEDKKLIFLLNQLSHIVKISEKKSFEEELAHWYEKVFFPWYTDSKHPEKTQRLICLRKIFLKEWDIDSGLKALYTLLVDVEFNQKLSPQQIYTRLKMIEGYVNYYLDRVTCVEASLKDILDSFRKALSNVRNALELSFKVYSPYAFAKSVPSMTARMPTECIVHFLAVIQQQQKQSLSASEHGFLKALQTQLKQKFYAHDLSVRSLRLWLKTTQAECQKIFPNLNILCTTLLHQLPRDDKEIVNTKAFENIYKRVFESALIDNLVRNPPQEALKATHVAALCFADYLKSIHPSWVKKILDELLDEFTQDERFWMEKDQALQDLLVGTDDDVKQFYAYLRQPPKDGIRCLAIPYIISSFSLLLDHMLRDESKGFVPWLERSHTYNIHVIKPLRKRAEFSEIDKEDMKISMPFIQAKDWRGGITLFHQPAVIHTEAASIRPTTQYKILFEGYNVFALSHGLPLASGISGTANMQLHFLAYVQAKKVQINKLAFLQAMIMFLVYDGGHSIFEVLFTAHLLDQKAIFVRYLQTLKSTHGDEAFKDYMASPWLKELDLDLGLDEGVAPEKFIADYQKFFDLYKDGSMHAAAEKAWDTTLEYFEKYSSFA